MFNTRPFTRFNFSIHLFPDETLGKAVHILKKTRSLKLKFRKNDRDFSTEIR